MGLFDDPGQRVEEVGGDSAVDHIEEMNRERLPTAGSRVVLDGDGGLCVGVREDRS